MTRLNSSKMASTRDLHHRFRPYADWLVAVGKYYDSRLIVTSSRRSPALQARLYQDWINGRSRIPAAPPGRSLHQRGLAVDIARLGVDPLNDPLLNYLGQLWTSYGGKWGGARDPVHFQPPGFT